MNLASPRTLDQAQRELLCNAVHMMTGEQLAMFYREAGPFCMEVLLDATAPTKRQEPKEEKPKEKPRWQSVERVSQSESDRLIGELREFLGEDGWNEKGLREILPGQGGAKTAKALSNGGLSHPLSVNSASAIRDFLEGRQ